MELRRRQFIVGSAAAAALPVGPVARAAAPETPAEEVLTANARLVADLQEAEEGSIPWKWIVIHHTAAEYASLEGIDRYHRRRFGDPLGAEYHFLIGNGRKAPAGLIQPARWRHRARAIHLFRPERAPDALALCLVGNFEKREPSGAELDGLRAVTRALMKRFRISVQRVTTHRGVDGRLTQCPGKHFPTRRFLASLASTGVETAFGAQLRSH